jgi:hypothetical protein
MPPATVWQVLKTCLHMKPYRLQLLQALSDNDKGACSTFCVDFQSMISDNENLISKVVLNDEVTFHVSGRVNIHSC